MPLLRHERIATGIQNIEWFEQKRKKRNEATATFKWPANQIVWQKKNSDKGQI